MSRKYSSAKQGTGRQLNGAELEKLGRSVVDDTQACRCSELFKVLGDPTRVRILSALLARELCVCDLSGLLGMSMSAVSHQLRLLRAQRIVRSRREGQRIFYSLDDSHVAGFLSEAIDHATHG